MENNRRHREKLFFLMFGGVIGIVLLIIGGFQLMEFTDSVAFCGQLCHNVMNPEYTAYQASPHSRVPCADCHVGPGASYLVKSKISGIPMILASITGKFDKPIPVPVANLRPARETCEQCHRPQKFSGDLVRTHTTYLTDEANTKQVDTRVLRIGGGESSTAQGIHWHIAAEVWYLPLDEQRQKIGWVGIEGSSGNYITQYVDPQMAGKITPDQISAGRRLMDCVDCHNRATHVFQSPEQLIDAALEQGKIDSTLPYIKREAARALYPQNPSLGEAYAKVEAISDFYKSSYPQIFASTTPQISVSKKEAIDQAINELKEVARLTTFPDMKVNWETYPDNMGHQDSDGCFRCHGALVSIKGSQKGESIDASCGLCHYPITPSNNK